MLKNKEREKEKKKYIYIYEKKTHTPYITKMKILLEAFTILKVKCY